MVTLKTGNEVAARFLGDRADGDRSQQGLTAKELTGVSG